MDRKFLTTLMVSAGLAACAAALFYKFAGASAGRSNPQLANVVYASTNLPIGAKIRRVDVKLAAVPLSMKPKDSFDRLEDVVDRPVIAAIVQDEPVLKQRLAEPGSGAGLAPIIPPGYRAVAVRVNDVIGVAGYVEPGMKVDVLVTGHPPQSEETITRTVLQNIVVLSAGQVLQPEPKGQAINATVVTLQVTPREAELLTLATDGGHIQLVLRNSTDVTLQATTGAQLSSMYGIAKPHPVATADPKPHAVLRVAHADPPPPLAAAAVMDTVEVIRGTARTLEHISARTLSTGAAK